MGLRYVKGYVPMMCFNQKTHVDRYAMYVKSHFFKCNYRI